MTINPATGWDSYFEWNDGIGFIDAIESDREACVNIEETYKTHELCVAIDRSMESGEKVTLPLEP